MPTGRIRWLRVRSEAQASSLCPTNSYLWAGVIECVHMCDDFHGHFTVTLPRKRPNRKHLKSLSIYDLVVFFEKSGIIYTEIEG